MQSSDNCKNKILIIDDEPISTHYLSKLVAGFGYNVTTASSGLVAMQELTARPYDVVLSDIFMPEMDGLTLLQNIRAHDLDVPIILVTGEPGLETAMKALESGAFNYLIKPVKPEALKQQVQRAVKIHEVARRTRVALQLVNDEKMLLGNMAAYEVQFSNALASLWMAYQPIVSWTKKIVYGYEALLRCDESRLAKPLEFLKVAQMLNRVHDVGRAVRRKVAGARRDLGTEIKLFNNLHPLDLQDPDLYSSVSPFSKIAQTLVIEVIERMALEGIPDVKSKICALHKMGFGIAIDDMGAGYSGLTSFTQYKADIVKVDMSLTRNIDRDERKQQVVQALVRLCNELGALVIIEGVETTAERDVLIAIGCDLFQGYLFGRPVPEFAAPRF